MHGTQTSDLCRCTGSPVCVCVVTACPLKHSKFFLNMFLWNTAEQVNCYLRAPAPWKNSLWTITSLALVEFIQFADCSFTLGWNVKWDPKFHNLLFITVSYFFWRFLSQGFWDMLVQEMTQNQTNAWWAYKYYKWIIPFSVHYSF